MKEKKTLVVNLYGGPGSGKSTIMSGLFEELKWAGVNCEMAHEYAKEKVWEKSFFTLDDQIYVFANQLHKVFRVDGQVDVIISDSPLLLSLIYDKSGLKEFHDLVIAVDKRHTSLNIFLKRMKKYNPSGRMQTKDEAIKKDEDILGLLDKHDIDYSIMNGERESVEKIAQLVLKKIGRSK